MLTALELCILVLVIHKKRGVLRFVCFLLRLGWSCVTGGAQSTVCRYNVNTIFIGIICQVLSGCGGYTPCVFKLTRCGYMLCLLPVSRTLSNIEVLPWALIQQNKYPVRFALKSLVFCGSSVVKCTLRFSPTLQSFLTKYPQNKKKRQSN